MTHQINLRLWADGDLPLLQRLMGDPLMTAHLGGPETPAQIRHRHARYCRLPTVGDDRMFVILAGPQQVPAGSIGYWESEWQDAAVWETGWSVLPEFQSQGIATAALRLLLPRLRAVGGHRYLHAFPAIDNAPSNAICRKAGFTLQGEATAEYPAGRFMQVHDWRLDLADDTAVTP